MSLTSFHLFEGAANGTLRQLRAFGMLRIRLNKMPGVLFGKAMGCGKGAAFSVWPDWNRWAVMVECIDEASEKEVINGAAFAALKAASLGHRSWRLSAFKKKGLWDGRSPFQLEGDKGTSAVAVLTRANIAPGKLRAFVRHSYATTEALNAAPGLRFSLGMGELPLIRQATFTLWESDAAMTAYAYKDPRHLAAMKEKGKSGMFTEEMFVRFRVRPLPVTG